jgi:hypothetical protein
MVDDGGPAVPPLALVSWFEARTAGGAFRFEYGELVSLDQVREVDGSHSGGGPQLVGDRGQDRSALDRPERRRDLRGLLPLRG